jgi:hypothetical protein
MCTYVDTHLSLPSLKYTVVAWLLTCLQLSTSGDPDVMLNSHAATCIRSDLHVYVTRNRIQPRSPIVTWGGAVATQLRSRMATKYGLCSLLNIQHSPTTAYHPQSNGLVERFHRRLKDALRSRAAAADWHDHLPWVLLGIRTAFREDNEFSPAEAVYGSQLVLPGQFIDTAESPSPSFLRELQSTMTGRPPPPARHNTAPAPSTLPEELLLARLVLIRRDGAQPPLSPIYDGPYRVLERSTHFFLLEMGDRTDKVSTLRLKAARTPADTEPAKPPRRGRLVEQAPPDRAPPPKQRGRPRQVTFSLPPTAQPSTTSTSSASGRPLRAARPPNRLNL